ncbi:TIGR03118 family protein [Massilia agilis]|uniref:TIGR03118 family protein n=1 Tax=Massilia agilis TaxID=1811226 RepID=A0ABT2DBJ8_9BURK|nr:TIGR03118 family protein [Massilia agilis]MCS0808589.1 TIGR03118 family protein [Massilia agilis]
MNKLSTSLACAASALALSAAPSVLASDFYQQRNLVSDSPAVRAEHRDPNLVNAWGLAFNPYAVAWVADNGKGVATLYDGTGRPQNLVVTIPGVGGKPGNPTGTVFYGGPGFVVKKGNASAPSRFLFASEDGGIAGWAPSVERTSAIRVIDNSASHAIYKGIALSGTGRGTVLYATDFHNGKIDVFDANFARVTLPGQPFRDPNLPAGYGPFGIQSINGDLYVSYARQDPNREDDVKGPGFGFVSVFAPDGRFLRRFASAGPLNAPWGMALAPASFGRFGSRLLVGNFGDGLINAYDLATGKWLGQLKAPDRKPIRIDGLWGIAFGNGVNEQPVDTLFFSAGPNDESNGLYGRLDVAPGDEHDETPEGQY